MRAVLVEGERQTVLLGVYIPPSEDETDGETVGWIEKAYNDDPRPKILVGDLNVDLEEPKNARDTQICAMTANLGIECVHKHFGQRKRHGRWTWSMRRKGKVVKAKLDYIMAEDKRVFRRAYSIIPRGLVSDHRMLIVEYMEESAACKLYRRYKKERATLPLSIGESEEDLKFEYLEQLAREEEKEALEKAEWKDWISEETWALMDKRAAQQGRMSRRDAYVLAKEIKRSLAKDRQGRMNRVGEEIEEDLENNNPKSAFGKLKRWYRQSTGRPLKPTREDSEELTKEREQLYSKVENMFPMFPLVQVNTCSVDDSVPGEEEIANALRRMKNGKATGPSGIRADQIKIWRKRWKREMEKREEERDKELMAPWEMVVELVQEVYRSGKMPSRMMQAICVLIPKNDKGEYCWKQCGN